MKKLSLFALAAAGMLFGACSSDNDAVEQSQLKFTGNGDGYLAVNIQLPTDPATRAANDDFDDGLNGEYLVRDAALLLFQKATSETEGQAKFVSAQPIDWYDVKDDGSVGTSTDNLTNSYRAAAQIYGTIDKAELFALVCLNYTNVITITTDHKASIGSNTADTSTDFATFNSWTTNANLTKDGANDYFFMTNTVFCDIAGGSQASAVAFAATNVHTLASLNKSNIKNTKEEALANPAGDVFVERAVAKATLSKGSTAKFNPEGETLEIASIEWYLNNTEKNSYVVRNMGTSVGTWLGYSSEKFLTSYYYRMVGSAGFGITQLYPTVATNMFRTYWCEDPTYATAAPSLDTSVPSTWTDVDNTGTAKPQYCYENTFSVPNQNYKNTTRVVMKVTLSDTDPFYNVNGGNKRYKTANIGDAESYAINAIVNNADVYAAFQAKVVAGHSYNIKKEDFTVTFADNGTTQQREVTAITLNTGAGSNIATGITAGDLSAAPTIDPTTMTSIINAVNNSVKIMKFTGGVMYYTARIEHFANTALEAVSPFSDPSPYSDLAPWNVWEESAGKPVPASGTTADSYPGNYEQNYLGRYGMVRNNWYDIEVTNLNHIGEPVDPHATVDNGDTPDDNPAKYISLKVHILSWAKRTQRWSF